VYIVQKAGNENTIEKSCPSVYLFSKTNEWLSMKIIIIEHILGKLSNKFYVGLTSTLDKLRTNLKSVSKK
jgi:hypothetical protein